MTETSTAKFYGKYRGVVLNNVDPMKRGRLMLQVPDVLGSTPSGWALPCVPVGGRQMGAYVVPPIGAGVWVEFEQGDPGYPVWVGSWWESAAEVPALANATTPGLDVMVFQTTLQNTLVISDMAGPTGGIMLKSTTGAMILINDTGITISNGKGATILMVGNTVTINNGALTII